MCFGGWGLGFTQKFAIILGILWVSSAVRVCRRSCNHCWGQCRRIRGFLTSSVRGSAASKVGKAIACWVVFTELKSSYHIMEYLGLRFEGLDYHNMGIQSIINNRVSSLQQLSLSSLTATQLEEASFLMVSGFDSELESPPAMRLRV